MANKKDDMTQPAMTGEEVLATFDALLGTHGDDCYDPNCVVRIQARQARTAVAALLAEKNALDDLCAKRFDEIAALLAEREWQPIETAPKDHLPILTWSIDTGRIVSFRDVTWQWWPCPALTPLKGVPTHWMQLPDIPPLLRDRAGCQEREQLTGFTTGITKK